MSEADTSSGDVGPPLGTDPAAIARLEAIAAEVTRLGSCSAACLGELERLDAAFRRNADVRALLERAYLERRDWPALIALAEEMPKAERSRSDRTRLSAYYYRAGRFRDAAAQLEKLLDESPSDADLARQYGLVLFELGDYDQARESLLGALPRLSGQPAAEAATVLGLIHFHRGELREAAAQLERALAWQGDSISALGALARVRAAQGDDAAASELLARAATGRQELVARERAAMLMSIRARMASDAWSKGRHEESERILLEMLVTAAPAQQVGLYRFLSAVRRDAGRVAEADAALREAARIEQVLNAERELPDVDQ